MFCRAVFFNFVNTFSPVHQKFKLSIFESFVYWSDRLSHGLKHILGQSFQHSGGTQSFLKDSCLKRAAEGLEIKLLLLFLSTKIRQDVCTSFFVPMVWRRYFHACFTIIRWIPLASDRHMRYFWKQNRVNWLVRPLFPMPSMDTLKMKWTKRSSDVAPLTQRPMKVSKCSRLQEKKPAAQHQQPLPPARTFWVSEAAVKGWSLNIYFLFPLSTISLLALNAHALHKRHKRSPPI